MKFYVYQIISNLLSNNKYNLMKYLIITSKKFDVWLNMKLVYNQLLLRKLLSDLLHIHGFYDMNKKLTQTINRMIFIQFFKIYNQLEEIVLTKKCFNIIDKYKKKNL